MHEPTPPPEKPQGAEPIAETPLYVLMKRGLFYRPNGNGYTNSIDEAWKVSLEIARKHVYPHDEPVTMHLLGSFPKSQVMELTEKLTAATEALEKAKADFADSIEKHYATHKQLQQSGKREAALREALADLEERICDRLDPDSPTNGSMLAMLAVARAALSQQAPTNDTQPI